MHQRFWCRIVSLKRDAHGRRPHRQTRQSRVKLYLFAGIGKEPHVVSDVGLELAEALAEFVCWG